MVDGNREKMKKSKFKRRSLIEALQISFPLPLNIQGTCPSPVPLLSPEPEVTSLQLPTCQSRTAMLISRETIWTSRGEIGDHLQHKCQECYRNSHKPQTLKCTFKRGAQLSITNRTPHFTSVDSSGIQ